MKRNETNTALPVGSAKTSVPKVSIVIPVYNVEKYLERCLDSVVKQTLEDIEIIVVNDGSKDNSLDIIKAFVARDSRVKLIDKPNSGYGNSMNRGFAAATGEYIGIVESDDFITPDMFESLYDMTLNGTVDVVKGNFFDYYDQEDKPPLIIANNARDMIPDSQEPFTLKDHPEISEGHPSVWSAIYRHEFILENNIRFMEPKGAGWVDNPFFYETLCKAKSIMWTKKAFYYYYKSNPTSSSNLQLDCSLPFVRMLDNMDIVEQNCIDPGIIHSTNLRAFMYLRGALVDFDYGACDKQLTEYALKVMHRLDGDIVKRYANLDDQLLYYTYGSPLKNIRAGFPKILICSFVPFDNPWNIGGSVTEYCKKLIGDILDTNPMVNIYFLSSGWAYDATLDKIKLNKIYCSFDERVHQYEIVNSPVPVDEEQYIFNPETINGSEAMKELLRSFLEERGPFSAVHFNGLDGFTSDVLELKEEFPETRFVYLLHDFAGTCLDKNIASQADEDMFEETNKAADIVYRKGRYNKEAKNCYTKKGWLKKLGMSDLQTNIYKGQAEKYASLAVKRINDYCDTIVAVSDHVRSEAVSGGLDGDKIQVKYNSVKSDYSAIHKSAPSAGSGLKLFIYSDDAADEKEGNAFITEALSKMPLKYISKIDIVAAVPNYECAEIRSSLKNFRSVKAVPGFNERELPRFISDCDIVIDPVPGCGSVSGIALNAAANGVPVISCSSSGASELCGSEKFKYELNDVDSFIATVAHFIDSPEDLSEYWTKNVKPVTAKAYAESMLELYDVENKAAVSISAEDYSWVAKENSFLMKHFSSDANKTTPEPVLNELKDKLRKALEENEKLKMENKKMKQTNGKITFQTEYNPAMGNIGANLFKLTLDNFDYNDFYAEIKFVKLANMGASVSDVLAISGTWYNSQLQLHQVNWQNEKQPLRDWINMWVDGNSVCFFAKHNGRACGYDYDIQTLTSRADYDSVKVQKINQGFVTEAEKGPANIIAASK